VVNDAGRTSGNAARRDCAPARPKRRALAIADERSKENVELRAEIERLHRELEA
jgi:hypothetical protein